MKQRQTNSIPYRLGRHIKRTKCMLLNRRGDGVHSPFAFRIIRQVLRNPHPYGAFAKLKVLQRTRRDAIREATQHRAIISRKHLEIIFRLAVDCEATYIHLLTTNPSLVADYITEARPLALISQTFSEHQDMFPLEIRKAELIVVEDIQAEALELLTQALISRDLSPQAHILVLNTYNPKIRVSLKELRKKLKADVQFDLKGLEIWVWRKGITPGRYSVYC
ncbi:MAG: hypothetical protein Q4A61_02870 [Porphyromonadaceae bacterium]|nr:hypothetical protein [Porphyromonadaceae bacterium]